MIDGDTDGGTQTRYININCVGLRHYSSGDGGTVRNRNLPWCTRSADRFRPRSPAGGRRCVDMQQVLEAPAAVLNLADAHLVAVAPVSPAGG
jgi:hypothetical protein